MSDALKAAARLIADARRVVALTGAGISAESGIPTFREAQTGLWARFSPEALATPEAFAAAPERVWAWYRWRRSLIARGGVNAGHRALAELGTQVPLEVVTQNVDGLHTAAGSPDVAELHGNIWRERCTACGHESSTAIIDHPGDDLALPSCAQCNALTRPAVVWFGETLPVDALTTAEAYIREADCVLVIGTSNRVYPAAALVEHALRGPASVIEINIETTPISGSVAVHLAESASHALPQISRRIKARA
ncbi:NAD-dependent deacylase [Salinisphaera sp. T31B1]|uniref:SIR2 family NAD-dependent protein deacylase n=1 Tax=Salinisphaera sp. T31B1 TaxID=727963 RepID=UPI0033405E7F